MHGFWQLLPDGCLAGLAQLSQLISLELKGTWSGMVKQLQQLLAQPLPLRKLGHDVAEFRVKASMLSTLPSLTHLTQLTELVTLDDLPDNAALQQLPSSLRSLCICRCRDLAPFMALQQLQRLSMFPELREQHRVP
jgi:hypothetical protein